MPSRGRASDICHLSVPYEVCFCLCCNTQLEFPYENNIHLSDSSSGNRLSFRVGELAYVPYFHQVWSDINSARHRNSNHFSKQGGPSALPAYVHYGDCTTIKFSGLGCDIPVKEE